MPADACNVASEAACCASMLGKRSECWEPQPASTPHSTIVTQINCSTALTDANNVRGRVLQAVCPLRLAQPAQRDVQGHGGDECIVRHLQARKQSTRLVLR